MMSQSRSRYGLCPECGDEVRLATVDQAAALVGKGSIEIYREIEAGRVHFMETGGTLLVCSKSLSLQRQRKSY